MRTLRGKRAQSLVDVGMECPTETPGEPIPWSRGRNRRFSVHALASAQTSCVGDSAIVLRKSGIDTVDELIVAERLA